MTRQKRKRCEKAGRWKSPQWLMWETWGAPMSLCSLPRTTLLLPSVCVGRKETDEGFTVGSWLVHIPGVVFLPSAPRPYQRPLKQQAVRLWQLASNSSYSSPAPRFPASPRGRACVICICVRACRCLHVSVSAVKCLFGLYMQIDVWPLVSVSVCIYHFKISRTSVAET